MLVPYKSYHFTTLSNDFLCVPKVLKSTPFFFRSEPRASISSVKDVYPGSPDSSLYGSDEEQEDASQYCRGGYHPVRTFISLQRIHIPNFELLFF